MYLFLKGFILISKHPLKIMSALFILLTSLTFIKTTKNVVRILVSKRPLPGRGTKIPHKLCVWCGQKKKNCLPQKATTSNLEMPKLITFYYTEKGSRLKYSFNAQN